MVKLQLKNIVEDEVRKSESQFRKSDVQFSKDEVDKIIYPDTIRILTILQMISPFASQIRERSLPYRGLEIGSGYGSLLLSLVKIFSDFEWTGLEHPQREYIKDDKYLKFFQQNDCQIKLCDLAEQKLPFENDYFSLITFSEVIEHLPPEKVLTVINEINRILCSKGYIIVSSPNLVSLNNRIKLFLGKTIFEPPIPLPDKGNTFGHVRLYTAEEFIYLCRTTRLIPRQIKYKSVFYNWKYTTQSWKNIIYKVSWLLELLCKPLMNKLADTWYILLEKP